jgi:hypothetical protein
MDPVAVLAHALRSAASSLREMVQAETRRRMMEGPAPIVIEGGQRIALLEIALRDAPQPVRLGTRESQHHHVRYATWFDRTRSLLS